MKYKPCTGVYGQRLKISHYIDQKFSKVLVPKIMWALLVSGQLRKILLWKSKLQNALSPLV